MARRSFTREFKLEAILCLIFFMLFMHRGSLTETLVVMLSVPFSLSGAIWLLWWLEFKLSVAVWVGMIAVAGLAVELGLLMVLVVFPAIFVFWRGRGLPEGPVTPVLTGAGKHAG